jgi:4-amino-4-deoxy-L-arabinose transferase-like glycosyltransferase
MSDSPWRRHRVALLLAVLLASYGAIALDGLDRLPIAQGDEMWIAAPAFELVTRGVYGSELFTGHAGAERRTYQFMPLNQLLLAGVFRTAGVGLVQMRLLSVAAGAVVLLLTFLLGRQAGGARVGVLAVVVLTAIRLAPLPLPHTGIVLADLVRMMRYDVLVPLFGLLALLVFGRAESGGRRGGYLLAGALAACAFLSHMYGAFFLAAMWFVVIARRGAARGTVRPIVDLAAGFAFVSLPWAAYVLGDLDAYVGQMRMNADRLQVLDPAFYLRNLLTEYVRYVPFGWRDPWLWHPGGWLAALTFPPALVLAIREGWRHRHGQKFVVVVALVAVVVLDALLLHWKAFSYVLAPLPLAAIVMASGWARLWDRARGGAARGLLAAALAVTVASAGWRVVVRHHEAARTTPYDAIAAEIARFVPADARVLIAHRFWLGLRDREVRTWLLPFVRAQCDACDRPRALADALRAIEPDVIAIDDLEFGPYFEAIRDPAHPYHWQDAPLRAYLAERQLELVGEVRDPAYLRIRVYRVRNP